MISLLFSLVYYLVLLALVLIAALACLVLYVGIRSNGWPKKKRFCTSTRRLEGKTVLITGIAI